MYSDYLVFFDNQLSCLGLQETLNSYFYSIPDSIGSQLQPLVQLSFGIEHNLPQMITQALAYYATSYLDVSNIMDYCLDHSATKGVQSQHSNIANTILFDLIASDQRFGGKIEGNNTFHSSVKLLIKSKYDLIKTYMTTWSTLSSNLSLEQRLDTLLHTVVTLTHKSSRQQGNSIELDSFMAGGQFIDAVFAIKRLIRSSNDAAHFINLLFLSILSTFVVQGRPTQSIHVEPKMNWESCISTVIQSAQPKSILALASILKVTKHVDNEPLLYLELANTLAQFVLLDGAWVKGGLGWSK